MRPFPSPAAPSHLGILALSAALRTLPAQTRDDAVNIATSYSTNSKRKKKELTGTCCPGDHRPEGGTGSSADDRKDMPAWPSIRGACVPTGAK